MSQIVKQTINVRSGNGFRDSIIFMAYDRRPRNSNGSWRSLDFRVPLGGIARNPSFEIKIKAAIRSVWPQRDRPHL